MPSIIAHATGMPISVETRFDTVFDFIASQFVNPSHFLQRSPSITITGINNINIRGSVKAIMGMPASASRGARACIMLFCESTTSILNL